MKIRLLLTLVFCWALCAWTLAPRAASGKELGIGSKAPPLDIEHWIQDGNGFFSPVRSFDSGKVYVVEFWATWCGPCIASMPHLAELQNKYRGRDVQIISVSDETLDEVNDLLAQENEEVGKTFQEITSAYSLTTDPDGSVHSDYMEASNQAGIPTSFIVGKSGLIEWIGHPMELDEPLEAVVTDSWDREKFKEEMKKQQEFEEKMQQVSRMAGAGKFMEAIELVQGQLEAVEDGQMRDYLVAMQNSLKLSAGLLDDDVMDYYRGQIKSMKGDPFSLGKFAYSIYGKAQEGAEVGPLAKAAIRALASEVGSADPELKPLLYNTLALLHDELGQVELAIKAQQAAIDAADARQKKRLMPFLEELKEKAGQSDEPVQTTDDDS